MDQIYNEYSKMIYSYLLSLTKNADIAEELLQETFYSAVKNINKFRKESNVKTWLCTIAKNKYIDYYKKSKKINEIKINDCDEIYLSTDSFEKDYLNKDDLLNIYRKIHALDEKSREVVYLRTSTNFNFREIGSIFGKSEEWARINFYRAKIKLKEDFENEQKK